MNLGEHENSENKLSLNEWKEVTESVAAFATARGGVVRIGVDPSTLERKGVQIGQTTLEQLADSIKTNTNPPRFPSVGVEKLEAGVLAVIEVHVEESPVKPIWAFGRPYKRMGRANQRLSPEETKRLMEPTAATENALESLALLTDALPSNAAALLFASNPQKFFPEAQVKCARFQGTTSVDFLDQQTLEGDVLTQLEKALAFVSRNTQQRIQITGEAERNYRI